MDPYSSHSINLQVELNQQSTIKAIVTKGRDGCCKQWVTKYVMMYSTDGKHWQEYGSNPAHVRSYTEKFTDLTSGQYHIRK